MTHLMPLHVFHYELRTS